MIRSYAGSPKQRVGYALSSPITGPILWRSTSQRRDPGSDISSIRKRMFTLGISVVALWVRRRIPLSGGISLRRSPEWTIATLSYFQQNLSSASFALRSA